MTDKTHPNDTRDANSGSETTDGPTPGLAARLATLEPAVERRPGRVRAQGGDIDDPSTPAGDPSTPTEGAGVPVAVTRRGILTAGSLLALLGLGARPAAADPQGQVGTDTDPLVRLYTQEVSSGAGAPLVFTVGGNRVLFLDGESGADAGNVVAGHSSNSVETGAVGGTVGGGGVDDGSTRLPNVVYDDYGTVGGGRGNRAGGDDSDPTTAQGATVGGGLENTASGTSATVAGGDGNTASGTSATVGGGLSNTASGSWSTVGGGRQNTASDSSSTVGGGFANIASDTQATVGGGLSNTASGNTSTVSGGFDNTASGLRSTVGGGNNNTAAAWFATVGGGFDNTASGRASTVGGGDNNTAAANYATIGGGGPSDPSTSTSREATKNVVYDDYGTVGGGGGNTVGTDDGDTTTARFGTVGGGVGNTASGERSTVGGGGGNTADGDYSFAVGRRANTNGHAGAFVFGDSSTTAFSAGGPNALWVQGPVNATAFNNTSTRTKKSNVAPVDPESVLASVESLDVSTWEFTDHDDGTHMGPMAEDFHDVFGLGDDEQRISTVDADGVALAAIQGLSRRNAALVDRLDARDDRIEDLETAVDERDDRIDTLEAEADTTDDRVAALEAENQALRDRLDAIEARLGDAGRPSPEVADD